ncbi:MAG: response regulator [Balneolaceae bacterium]|nr:MAG: response regulator [Balneolaceae bacterium]
MEEKGKKVASVFIIEDNQVLLMITRKLVESLGYHIAGEAMSDLEALQGIRSSEPDIILSDIHIEGDKSGIEVIAEAREFSNAPVIFISGSSGYTDMDLAEKVGFVEYLLKPVRKEILAEALDNATRTLNQQKISLSA